MRTSRPSGGFVTGFDDDHSNSVVCIRVFCIDREGKNAGAEIPGIMLSAYTLVISVTGITKIISFIRNGFKEYPLVKYRSYGSPVMSAAKVVNMSTALFTIICSSIRIKNGVGD